MNSRATHYRLELLLHLTLMNLFLFFELFLEFLGLMLPMFDLEFEFINLLLSFDFLSCEVLFQVIKFSHSGLFLLVQLGGQLFTISDFNLQFFGQLFYGFLLGLDNTGVNFFPLSVGAIFDLLSIGVCQVLQLVEPLFHALGLFFLILQFANSMKHLLLFLFLVVFEMLVCRLLNLLQLYFEELLGFLYLVFQLLQSYLILNMVLLELQVVGRDVLMHHLVDPTSHSCLEFLIICFQFLGTVGYLLLLLDFPLQFILHFPNIALPFCKSFSELRNSNAIFLLLLIFVLDGIKRLCIIILKCDSFKSLVFIVNKLFVVHFYVLLQLLYNALVFLKCFISRTLHQLLLLFHPIQPLLQQFNFTLETLRCILQIVLERRNLAFEFGIIFHQPLCLCLQSICSVTFPPYLLINKCFLSTQVSQLLLHLTVDVMHFFNVLIVCQQILLQTVLVADTGGNFHVFIFQLFAGFCKLSISLIEQSSELLPLFVLE